MTFKFLIKVARIHIKKVNLTKSSFLQELGKSTVNISHQQQ